MDNARFQPLTRWAIAMLSWHVVWSMVDVASIITWSPSSVTRALAEHAGHPSLIAWAYTLSAALVLPYIVALVVPQIGITRLAIKCAALGAACASVSWMAQVFLTIGSDFAVIRAMYFRSAVECMAYAIYLGVLLNAELRTAAALEGCPPGTCDRVKLPSRPMELH